MVNGSHPPRPADATPQPAVDLPRGILTALITPVTHAGAVDQEALDRVIARVLHGGVVGLSPCGSTGEGARLTAEQRLEVAQRVISRAPHVPVIPGVPVTALPAAHEELAELGRCGAAAALIAPPSYYPATDGELIAMYESLAESSAVPLLLYDVPMFSGVKLSAQVVARLARHPQIIGLKDSSRDMESLLSILFAVRGQAGQEDLRNRFAVYTGTDTLLAASLDAGADGAITASSNFVPRLGVDLIEAMAAGDRESAARLQQRLTQVVNLCRRGTPPAGWKAAMSLAGVCRPDLVPPAPGLTRDQTEELRAALAALHVLPSSDA